MKILPAIDILAGSCVRLIQGDFAQRTVYGKNPVQMAQHWVNLGARGLHLVDLDGARDGSLQNEAVIEELVKSVKVPVQLGGGIRDSAAIERCFSIGVNQVILGTAALAGPDWLREMILNFGERIIVSLDAKAGFVAKDGWQNLSQLAAVDFARQLKALGLKRIVYTDIGRDGMLSGPNIAMYKALIQEVSLEIIASGGVTTLAQIKQLKRTGLYGAIIGKALYEGKLALQEVLEWQKCESSPV